MSKATKYDNRFSGVVGLFSKHFMRGYGALDTAGVRYDTTLNAEHELSMRDADGELIAFCALKPVKARKSDASPIARGVLVYDSTNKKVSIVMYRNKNKDGDVVYGWSVDLPMASSDDDAVEMF